MYGKVSSGLVLVSLAVLPLLAADRAAPAGARGTAKVAQVRDEIVSASNRFRGQQKQRKLQVDAKLSKTAQEFAEFMARTDKYGHTADGKEPWERAKARDYDYCIILENIAYQYNSGGFTTHDLVQGFMTGWKKSPPHRKNLLDPDVYEIGVGVAYSTKSGKYYAVQNFGSPKSKAIVFAITNETESPVKYLVDGKSQTVRPRYTMTHERCRPPKLALASSGDDPTVPKGKVFQPRNGSKYVIREDDKGEWSLQEKEG